ncbi:unnamed protein product [Closterium sp. NIES-54]
MNSGQPPTRMAFRGSTARLVVVLHLVLAFALLTTTQRIAVRDYGSGSDTCNHRSGHSLPPFLLLHSPSPFPSLPPLLRPLSPLPRSLSQPVLSICSFGSCFSLFTPAFTCRSQERHLRQRDRVSRFLNFNFSEADGLCGSWASDYAALHSRILERAFEAYLARQQAEKTRKGKKEVPSEGPLRMGTPEGGEGEMQKKEGMEEGKEAKTGEVEEVGEQKQKQDQGQRKEQEQEKEQKKKQKQKKKQQKQQQKQEQQNQQQKQENQQQLKRRRKLQEAPQNTIGNGSSTASQGELDRQQQEETKREQERLFQELVTEWLLLASCDAYVVSLSGYSSTAVHYANRPMAAFETGNCDPETPLQATFVPGQARGRI